MSSIAFAILAGGQSSRFRSDKRIARFRGRPLLGIMMDKAKSLGWPLILSVRDQSQMATLESMDGISWPGVRTVLDRPEVEGPIAGLMASLATVGHDYVFVTSSDLPLLETGTIQRLFRMASDPLAALCVPRTPRGIEPLASVYSCECASELELFVRNGGRSPEKFIHSLPPHRVRFCDFTLEDSRQFANINTPADLEALTISPPTTPSSTVHARTAHAG
ncbi:MAG: molybdenum cofactor guanylyltransferase [Nitrospirae bacterium]|nr:molybdenum cofactor guanylyltransferase [Nitrospirota bacterium]